MLKKVLMMICLSLSLQALDLHCSKPETLSDEYSDRVSKPMIRSNAAGDAVIAWVAYQDDDEAIQASFKAAEHNWSTPQTLSPWEGQLFSHDLAVDESGKISLCWRVERNEKSYIYYAQKVGGEWWTSPINVFNASTYSSTRRTHLLPNGKIIFIGQKEELGDVIEMGKNIPYQRINLSSISHAINYYYPGIFINSRGKGLIACQEREKKLHRLKCCWIGEKENSSPQDVYSILEINKGRVYGVDVVRSDHESSLSGAMSWIFSESLSGVWTEALQVVTCSEGEWSSIENFAPQKAEIKDYRIAMNSQDDVFIVCHLKQGKKSQLAVVYKPKGQGWVYSIPSLPVEEEVKLGSITSDMHGNFIILWHSCRDALRHLSLEKRSGVYGAMFSVENQALSNPVLLSPPALSCKSPSLALIEPGRGWITWKASNQFETAIQVAEFTYGDK